MDELAKQVKSADLKPGMIIREITKFDSKFRCLDSKSVDFLRANFKGATIVLKRNEVRHLLPCDDLKSLDEIDSIIDIPTELKFSNVVAGMGKAMHERGFFEFTVKLPPEGLADDPTSASESAPSPRSVRDPAHAARLEGAKQFLESMENASELRDQSSAVVEDMLHQGRAGKFSAQAAASAVEDILQQGASTAMKAVAGLRTSDQTYAHCVDMSVILQETYADILTGLGKEVTRETNHTILIAGFMHDIGKSQVPQEILDSTKRFAPDSEEMAAIRKHAKDGAKILTDLGFDKSTINVAHFHHVKKDTGLSNSYPGVPYSEVLPLTRLAAVVDVYQALIGNRKYKRSWVPGKAVQYLMGLRETEFEERMLGYFLRSIGIYPLGALIRLSSGELGFVIRIEPDSLERPVVAIVENAGGELLTHHQILDLVVEEDLSVVEVVDHFEHYNETEDQAYEVFRSIKPT